MNNELTTPSIDLLAPVSRFVTTSKLRSRLHRYKILWSRFWWMFVLIFLALVLPVYLLSLHMRPAYQSTARMWLTGKIDFSENRLYTEELVNYMGTQVELLRSRAIQERALAKTDLSSMPRPARAQPSNGLVKDLKSLASGAVRWLKTAFFPENSSAVNAPPRSPFKLKVEESSRSSTLELRATGPDPMATRAFLNNVMAEYLACKKQIRSQTAERAATSVSAQLSRLDAEIKAQQERLYSFQMSNNVVFLQEQGNSAGTYLAAVNKQLAGMRTELRLLQMIQPEQLLELAAKRETDGKDTDENSTRELLSSLSGPQAELFRATQQMQLLLGKRDELSKFLRPIHPKIIKLDQDIAAQQILVQGARKEMARQFANRREAVALQIKNLESAFAEWDTKALETSRKLADYDRIRQELQRLQSAHEKLLGLIQSVELNKTVDQENLSILEPASIALPRHLLARNLALSLGAGLLFVFGLFYLISTFDDRFASLTDLRNHIPEIVLGQVPQVPLGNTRAQLGVEYLERHQFEFLESFRNIRSSLLCMGRDSVAPKTILVTSSIPQEGKSTVALYLAATLALGGARVLLIDADMRRSYLHKAFRAPVSPGLAEMLDRGIFGTEPMASESLKNLFLLPAGEASRNPGELVLSSQWKVLLQQMSARFDYILVDSPPILATDDGVSLARQVDGVLFVVRGAYTSARLVGEALEALHQRKITLLGLIFNRAVSSACEYHHYQRYKKGYHWSGSGAKRLVQGNGERMVARQKE